MMSYRTYINNRQIFGNNEYHLEWEDFIKSHGIQMDDDGQYDGYVDDLQGMFNTIDLITRKLIEDRHIEVMLGEPNWRGEPYKELTDLSDSLWLDDETPLLQFNTYMINNAYCFLPYQAYKAVEDIIEPLEKQNSDEHEGKYFYPYKLKDGQRIHVYAS